MLFEKVRCFFLRYRKISRLIKIILCMVYCLVSGELYLRMFSPVPLLPHGWVVTSYGLRGNELSRSYRHSSPEYRITMQTNSQGLRADREIPYEKANGVNRIVLLGDSFAMGYGVNLEDTFSSQMQKRLAESGIHTEIVNMGVPTYSTAEELVVLMEEGFKYQPDLVLLAWHASDYSENIQTNLFALEDDRLVRKNKSYIPKAKVRKFLVKYPLYRWVSENSHFYKFIRNVIYSHVRKPLAEGIRSFSSYFKVGSEIDRPVIEAQVAMEKPKEAFRCKLAIALLKEIKHQCVVKGAKFLILDIPVRLSRTEFESRFPVNEESVSDLFEVFSPIKHFFEQKGQKIYWENSEGHFTPLGCRIVGEGLAERVLSKNMLCRN